MANFICFFVNLDVLAYLLLMLYHKKNKKEKQDFPLNPYSNKRKKTKKKKKMFPKNCDKNS